MLLLCGGRVAQLLLFSSSNNVMHHSPKNRINFLFACVQAVGRQIHSHTSANWTIFEAKCKELEWWMCGSCVCVYVTASNGYDAEGNTRSFHRHDSHKGLWNWRIVHKHTGICVPPLPPCLMVRTLAIVVNRLWIMNINTLVASLPFFVCVHLAVSWHRTTAYHAKRPIYYLW